MGTRAASDEHYVIDLCDEVLGSPAIRQATFDWLLGDPGKTGARRKLAVDAYWPSLDVAVEYNEKQHTEAVPFFDKPDVKTVSGVSRGEQRALYFQRRVELLPQHGIRLVVIDVTELAHRRGKLLRDRDHDLGVLRRRLLGPS